MRVSDLRYELPESAIAQHPVEPRDAARLLVSDRNQPLDHRFVRDLPSLVGPGDVLVVNDTKVLPARLRLHKVTGGAVEVLLLRPRDGARPHLGGAGAAGQAGAVRHGASRRPGHDPGGSRADPF